MPEYYLTQNAAKAVEVAGKKFVFEPAEFFSPTNSWWGTLAAEDPADIEALDAAAAKGLVEKLSEDDYAKFEVKKKKPSVSPNLIALKQWHAPQIGGQMDVAPAAVDKRAVELEDIASALEAKPVRSKAGK